MVQSVELVLDERLDVLVREEWELLVAADLPSQGRHTGASNAPHVTLGVADTIDPVAERALARIDYGAGLAVRLGGLLVFGGRTSVLSRVVVPTAHLMITHAAVASALDEAPGRPSTMRPGAWTPHVTLARRLDPAQLAAALRVLAERPKELDGTIRCGRRWDGDARSTWDVPAGR
ncbi:2'-5' RNA ligase family protein [Aeromicrobium endophyticum]|nr:2'-5' RNA ligase family protein [Aeromicrobium endophyticum]